jgi:serine/threonine protein kinase
MDLGGGSRGPLGVARNLKRPRNSRFSVGPEFAVRQTMPVLRLPTAALPLSGRRVELGELVGRGSRTAVHRGLLVADGGLRQRVVVKLFDSVPTDDSEGFIGSLAQAVARAALIEHPNVVQVHEHGVSAGRAYLVTEQVCGVSLEQLMRTLENEGQRLTFDVALFVGCEVADALAGAFAARDFEGFRARVLHGDLSARQVMLGFAGAVKVTDFEVGRVSTAQSGIRSMRAVASRLEMLAPELVLGDPAGPRTDVFALGMLLRTMFVGPRFPEGIPHSEALRMVRRGEVHCPPFHARLPQELYDLILTATAVLPEQRFPNARVLAWELRRIAFSHGVGDARPFLARALERAFPGQSPFAVDLDEDEDVDVWDDQDEAEPDALRDAYDSEYPPARPPSSPSFRAANDSGASHEERLSFHGDDEDADEDDLAQTQLARALSPARLPYDYVVHDTYDTGEDGFDPEATVNFRD